MQHQSPSRGFTIIEMAMALVIVGLLMGGVLAGRDLIRATKIRSIIDEANLPSNSSKASTATFRATCPMRQDIGKPIMEMGMASLNTAQR